MTKKGCGSSCVSPSTVTCSSDIASRRAACVFGGARFISSARTTFAKTGPSLNSKVRSRSLNTFVPVTSAGRRSGVNWMRLNERPSAVAKLCAVSVLPVPGTSSRRTCPRPSTPVITISKKSSLAITAEPISSMTDEHASLAAVTSASIRESGGGRDLVVSQAADERRHDRPRGVRPETGVRPVGGSTGSGGAVGRTWWGRYRRPAAVSPGVDSVRLEAGGFERGRESAWTRSEGVRRGGGVRPEA